MTFFLVDSNVLLDVVIDDPKLGGLATRAARSRRWAIRLGCDQVWVWR